MISTKTKIMMKRVLLLCLLVLALFACNKDNEEEKGSTSSTMIMVYLHDQPIDYQQVNVDIQSVKIKGNGTNEEVDLEENAGVYNLLDYQNGLDTLIGTITVEYDSINQIRLVLGPENSVMIDSILYPMETPSAQQSGLKIMLHSNLTYVDTLVISLDFDAAESVQLLGNGDYKLHPVIHVD